MNDRLDGLDVVEKVACRIVERALGVRAIAEDLPPKQGVVDAYLDYPDGRRAAFEVTRLSTDSGAMNQLSQLLEGSGVEFWPAPGEWFWTVEVGHPRDLPRLCRIFNGVALLCEELEVNDPANLRYMVWDDDEVWRDDINWIAKSSLKMYGHRPRGESSILATTGVVVSGPLIPPAYSRAPMSLENAITEVFASSHIQRRLTKLARTAADERHLFVFVTGQDLTANLFTNTPPLPNSSILPGELTHLWLTALYCGVTLLCSPEGWRRVALRELLPVVD